jgi:hypothetical protein
MTFVTGTFHIKTFEDHYHRTLGSWTSSADCMSPQTLSMSMFQNPAIASSAAGSGEAQCSQQLMMRHDDEDLCKPFCRALHRNNLYGPIPQEIGNCTTLKAL